MEVFSLHLVLVDEMLLPVKDLCPVVRARATTSDHNKTLLEDELIVDYDDSPYTDKSLSDQIIPDNPD